MSTQHTPGPWFVAKETDLQESDGNVVVSPNGWEIRPDGYQKLGDEMADLRLIAAAPDLLDALYTVEALLLSMGMQSSDAYQQTAAAIAKATGE